MTQLALNTSPAPQGPSNSPLAPGKTRSQPAGAHKRRPGTGRAARSYAKQREHMVAVARRRFPDANRLEAFAAPEVPYVVIWRERKGYYCAWWEIEE